MMAGLLAFAAVGVRLRDKMKENRGVTRMKMDVLDANNRAVIGVKFEEVEVEVGKKEGIQRDEVPRVALGLGRTKRLAERMMIGSWILGVCAYCIMAGRSKRPAFGFSGSSK